MWELSGNGGMIVFILYFNELISAYYWFYFCITDVIHGKLDQRNGRLEVDFAIGRDAQPNDIGQIISTLNDWCEACDVKDIKLNQLIINKSLINIIKLQAILGAVETQVINANNEKEKHVKHRATIEEEVNNIKKTLKTQVV